MIPEVGWPATLVSSKRWRWNRIAVHAHHLKRMCRQRQTSDFGGASVQDVEEDTLALLHFDWLAVMELAAIDGEGVVADLISMRHAFGERCLHRSLSLLFELRDC